VPVEQLARDVGAVISYQPFETEDISGLLYRAAGSAPVIGVNSSNSNLGSVSPSGTNSGTSLCIMATT
jgi:hypothetical protein